MLPLHNPFIPVNQVTPQHQGALDISPSTLKALHQAYLESNKTIYLDCIQQLKFKTPQQKYNHLLDLQQQWEKAERVLKDAFEHTEKVLQGKPKQQPQINNKTVRIIHKYLKRKAEDYDVNRYFVRSYHGFIDGLNQLGQNQSVALQPTVSKNMFQVVPLNESEPEAKLNTLLNFNSPEARQKAYPKIKGYITFMNKLNVQIHQNPKNFEEVVNNLPSMTRFYSDTQPLMNDFIPNIEPQGMKNTLA
jgi:hypothetical protein